MGLTTRVVRGEHAERLLVLLHGIGSNEHDLAALAPILDPDGRFVVLCPRAPYAWGPGFAWFRVEEPRLAGPTQLSSLEAIEEAMDEACETYGLDAAQAVVGGFSMGGAMALLFAFRRPPPWRDGRPRPRPAGVLVMSGFLPPTSLELDWTEPLPPVLMQHGTSDPMVPPGRARAAADELRSHGVPLVFREYPMDHTVTAESARDARDWLEQVRRGERPAGINARVERPVESGPVRTVDSTTFDELVLRSERPAIVDFWAPWCAPCRQIAPVVEEIATMRKGTYNVFKCNIDECPDIARRYDIRSIPMVALFRNGRLERASLGAKPRPQLEAELGMIVIP